MEKALGQMLELNFNQVRLGISETGNVPPQMVQMDGIVSVNLKFL